MTFDLESWPQRYSRNKMEGTFEDEFGRAPARVENVSLLHINYYILHKVHPRASIRNRWGSCASFILSTLHFYWLMDIFFKIRFWPYKIEASNALTYLLVSLFISVWYSLCSISRCAWATNRACKYRETKNSISVWLKAVPRLKCRECIFVRGIAN